ncbi:hypothetical protein [Streptomyces fulvoviolaceus]|uniref:hypothetical protein n=1 Tax=Streptomyces fulvoviolaceus TaxID=285535 RepID=UPI0004C913F8|nr:hypothetical protein [Streptomyces fulvoviolaceus]
MDSVVTEGSSVACEHHGTVSVVATAVHAVLQVAEKSVSADTLAGSTVDAKCIQNDPSKGQKQCTLILDQSEGSTSKVLYIDDKPVLLATAKGTTDGVPGNSWLVTDAAQDVLTAD